MKIAVYPGSFDPVTNGHLNIIERTTKIVDKLIVAVAVDSKKSILFSAQERTEMIKEATKNIEKVEEILFEGKGIIFCTAHFGSWELSAHYFGLKGFKSTVLYTPFKTPSWLEVFAKKRRQLSGNTLLPKGKSFIALYRTLKNGGSVILVSDQYAYPPEGIKVPLMGQSAWTHVAYIRMSLKTGIPIIPTFTYSRSMFSYSVEFTDPVYPQDYENESDPVLAMATEINKRLGAAIKRAPSLWMWQHKRFKILNESLRIT